jgi:hypothetical protein
VFGSSSPGINIHSFSHLPHESPRRFVVSSSLTPPLLTSPSGLYNETTPTDCADLINASYPFSVVYEMHKGITPYLASTIDR